MEKEKTAVKIKKKNWYEIVAPKIFDERIIGETTVTEPSKLIGKPVLLNLMVLTNDPKKQNISVKFIVDSVQDNRAITKFTGYYLNSSSLRRFMRKAATRIDDSFIAETADNINIRIKPFLLTRRDVTGSVSTNIRRLARSLIIKQIKKNTYEKLIIAIVTNKFQRSLSMAIKKIYPLRASEIREMYIEKDKKQKSETKPAAEEVGEKIKEEKPTEENNNLKEENNEQPDEIEEEVKNPVSE